MKKFSLALILSLFGMASMSAQTDVTNLLSNPDFEDGVLGWKNSGIGPQGNNDFEYKHGSKYVELWTGWGGTVSDRTIQQTVLDVPAGVYTLTVSGKNIQQGSPKDVQTGAFFFINDQEVEFGQPGDYSVATTCADGTLTVGAKTVGATGNWVCIDNFRLTYTVVADSLQDYIKGLIQEADAMDLNLSGDVQTELDAAKAALSAYIGSQNSEGLPEAIKRLRDAMRAYGLAAASKDNPLDITDAIKNASFEDGTKGWKSDGMNTQNNTSFPLKSGNSYLEKWTGGGNAIGSASIRQLVKDLPVGNYRLTCAAQNIQEGSPLTKQSGAYIYAGLNSTEVNVRASYEVEFTTISGQAEIGFVADNAQGNWIAVDNFRLYYMGASVDENMAQLQQSITAAEALTTSKMNSDTLAILTAAIEVAKTVTGVEGMASASLQLETAVASAKNSAEAYAKFIVVLEEAQSILNEDATGGLEDFSKIIAEAKAMYEGGTASNDDLVVTASALKYAMFAYRIANGKGTAPRVKTQPEIIYGCKAAVGRMITTGTSIIERGFCWSENPEPTVLDNRSSYYYEFNGPVYLMDNLKPSTTYYVRAYAINKNYAVGYGNTIRIITLNESDIEYSYNWAGDEETNNRMINSCDTAVYYLRKWTAIRGFRPSVNYDPGDSGAHGGYGGWITVGGGFAQNPGTVMHEMGHGIGVGQHWRYTSWDSPLHPTMYWTGERANRVFKFFENQPDEYNADGTLARSHSISDGDRVHVCYGLSGVTAPIDLLRQAAYYQGLYEDGMPAVGDGCCPFHSFDCQEGVKYYITNAEYGAGKKYLKETNGVFSYREMSLDDVLSDDSYAWYVTFNPLNCLYTIQNVKSGKYFTYNTSRSRFQAKEVTELTNDENMHLMPSRQMLTFDLEGVQFTVKPYWLARANRDIEPEVLIGASTPAVSTGKLDFYDTATPQHWAFLAADDLAPLSTGISVVEKDDKIGTEVEGYYDITGARIDQPRANGVTIVRYKDGHSKKIFKK